MLNDSQLEAVSMFHMYAAEFLASMLQLDPTNEQLVEYNNHYEMLHNSNKLQAIEYYYEFVYKYKQHILNQDIDYFLNIEDNQQIQKHKDSLLHALQLRNLWNNFSDNEKDINKEHIFQYLKILLYYTEQYYQL